MIIYLGCAALALAIISLPASCLFYYLLFLFAKHGPSLEQVEALTKSLRELDSKLKTEDGREELLTKLRRRLASTL